jgi:hypothetical protein
MEIVAETGSAEKVVKVVMEPSMMYMLPPMM